MAHAKGGKLFDSPVRLNYIIGIKSHILDSNLQLKWSVLLDIDREPAETAEEQFDSSFFLMTEELRQLLPDLVEILGGMTAD